MEESIFDREWRGGASAENHILDIKAELEPYTRRNDIHVVIGTDAQRSGKVTNFVTGIVVHDDFKLRKIYTCRTKVKHEMPIGEKLFKETALSAETAWLVSEICTQGQAQIEVHIDANPEMNRRGQYKFESGRYAQQLVGMIFGQGFAYQLKPNAWAASHLGDHFVKNKHLPRATAKEIKKKSRVKRKAVRRRANAT